MATTPRTELLAPAGDWPALRTAVRAGANAVYFGLPAFNARHRATNFTLAELPAVMAELHGHNVRGFVAFNTLVFADELPAAQEYLRAIAAAGVDAIIVQDLGLARLAKAVAPGLALHASTQMTLTEPRGIAFARRLGVERVVLPRELSAADIARVAGGTDAELEVFVHGALCVAYSGQCLTSEALGGRSANRGQCAQACRMPYELIADGEVRDLGDRAYLLSPQDLAAHDLVGDLAAAGVHSFKIEGRLKGEHYVAATTQAYRAALDAHAAGRPFALDDVGRRELEQVYSRGLSPGFLAGVNHQALVPARFPKHRGVFVGRVVAVGRGVVVGIEPELPADFVRPGDGVVFDEGNPEQPERGGRVYAAEPAGQGRVELRFGRDGFDPRAVAVGARVWKTDDPALKAKLERGIAQDRVVHRVPLAATLTGEPGGPLTITLVADVHTATATWPGPLEVARGRPFDPADAHATLGRLGDTPFALDQLDCRGLDGLMVPRSVLNDLRRRAAADLVTQRQRRVETAPGDPLAGLRATIPTRPPSAEPARLSVLVRTQDQLAAAIAWTPPIGLPPLALVVCDFEDTRRGRAAVSQCRAAGVPVGLATLRVVKPGEDGHLRQIAGYGPDTLLVRNLAALELYRAEFPHVELLGDYSLNVANELAADLLVRGGLQRLVPGFDLNWEQLADLVRRSDPRWYEPVVHQHMPMFHMEHCVFAAVLSDGKDWRDCGRPCDRHRVELRDRMGAAFPVAADTGCRNTVFNSVAQSAGEYLPRMLALGLRRFRVDLLRETAAETTALLDSYALAVAGRDDGRAAWRRVRALSQLGVTRGTLQLV